MKNVEVTIRATDVKGIKFQNSFANKPGEPLRIKIKTSAGVQFNPETPTMGFVIIKFEANDENNNLALELETITTLSVSTYVDNLEDVIKKNYMNSIMLSVNEKVRSVASVVGLNLTVPAIKFNYNAGEGSIDSEIMDNV